MIKLTRNDGKPVWINPDQVRAICVSDSESAAIYADDTNESILVKETPEEVARKVLEYRFALEEFKRMPDDVARVLWQSGPNWRMYDLAGLEVNNAGK